MNIEAGGAGNGMGDHFQKGEKVEVCSQEEGFRGSWLVATVITTNKLTDIQKKITDDAKIASSTSSSTSTTTASSSSGTVSNTASSRCSTGTTTASSSSHTGTGRSSSDNSYRKIRLEYDFLVSETDEEKKLIEDVDFLLVRPAPPREEDRSFAVNEEVDAFHLDGWWEGFITRVLPPKSPDKPVGYLIYFRGSRELLVFHQNEIRLHREWVYGEWKPPLEVQQAVEPPLP